MVMTVLVLVVAVTVALAAETGPEAVVDRQIRDLLDDEPSVPVAPDHRHRVLIGADRPVRDALPLTEDVEVDDQARRLWASREEPGPERVPKDVPARLIDEDRCATAQRWIADRIRRVRTWILGERATARRVRAGVDPEAWRLRRQLGTRVEHPVASVHCRAGIGRPRLIDRRAPVEARVVVRTCPAN